MARRQKRSRKRQEPAGSGSVLLLMAIAIVVVLAIIFLTVLEVDGEPLISSGVAAVLAMTLLAAILFLMWLRTSPARGGQRRKRKRKRPAAAAGPPVIEVPAVTIPAPVVPPPRVPLPPRPVRAARRRREYISYPVVVGGGDYADTYIQVDKDTVLKLRNEMTPNNGMAQLPGRRLARFPDPQAVAAVPVVAEATPVAAEPVAEEAEVDFDWE